MIRNLKMLGVALCAVLALSVVAASAASAELGLTYTASSYPTTITGESGLGNDTFVTEAGTLECKTHMEATLAGPSSQLTVKVKTTACKFGAFVAHAEMRSCHYLFETPKRVTVDTDHFTVPVQITCGSEPIIIKIGSTSSPVCEITVSGQTPSGHVIITNTTAAGDMVLQGTVTDITHNIVKDNFGCPFFGTGLKHGATEMQHKEKTFDSTNGANVHIGWFL